MSSSKHISFNKLKKQIIGLCDHFDSKHCKKTTNLKENLKTLLNMKKQMLTELNNDGLIINPKTIDNILEQLDSYKSLQIITKSDNNEIISNYVNRLENTDFNKFIYYPKSKIAQLHKILFSFIYKLLNHYTSELYINYDTDKYKILLQCYNHISSFNNKATEENILNSLNTLKTNILRILKTDKNIESITSIKGGKIFNYFESNENEIELTTDNIDKNCDDVLESLYSEFDKPDIYTHLLNEYKTQLTSHDSDTSPKSKKQRTTSQSLSKELVNTNVNAIFTINIIDKFAPASSTELEPKTYIQYLTLMYYLKFEKLLWYIIIQIINNKNNIEKFIKDQEEYLKSLEPYRKITIYTYTTTFYKLYNTWKTDKGVITNFKTIFSNDELYTNCNTLYESFVNSKTVFYYQIRIVLFNKIASIIGDYSKSDFDDQFPINYETPKLEDVISKLIDIYPSHSEEIYKLFPNNDLTIDDYNTILLLFGELLNEIIYNAPRITPGNEFTAFRGSNNNYIKNMAGLEKNGSYNNTRFSSYSVNPSLMEQIYYYFYNLEYKTVSQTRQDKFRRLYEISFTSDAILLFAAPVSKNPLEFEIISAENSIINIIDNNIINIYRYNKSDYDIYEDVYNFEEDNLLCKEDRQKINLLRIVS